MSAGFQVRDGSGDHAATAIQVYDAGDTDRTIIQGRIIGPDGVDRVFFDPSGSASFTAAASPAAVAGHGISTVTTGATTVTPTGGTSPYSYAWTVTSHTNATAPTVNSATSATTTFTQTNLSPGAVDQATFRCAVTDSASPANTATVDVNASFWDTSSL